MADIGCAPATRCVLHGLLYSPKIVKSIFMKRLLYPFLAFFRPVLSPRCFKIEHDSFPLGDEEGPAYVVDGFG
jgi:hypothetical protein